MPETTTTTVQTTKPEIKQISNYLGAAALGVAGFIVSHGDLISTLAPPPWNAVATAVISAIGGALIAYREKHTVSTTTESVK